MNAKLFGALVVKEATKHLGTVERPNNQGFYDQEFNRLISEYGFSRGMAWCALFAELCCRQAAQSAGLKSLDALYDKYFSAHCLTTWQRFDASPQFLTRQPGTYKTIDPEAGDIGLMQMGGTTAGHAVIITGPKRLGLGGWVVDTIEGNTSASGSREGTTVLRKVRKLNGKRGLHFVGFVRPKDAHIL